MLLLFNRAMLASCSIKHVTRFVDYFARLFSFINRHIAYSVVYVTRSVDYMAHLFSCSKRHMTKYVDYVIYSFSCCKRCGLEVAYHRLVCASGNV